ncbi:MAG: hypothetical protein HYV60_05735 [Planctomycetia bacterium]|nr:hypothetical protein [Planctomycetia bacterium]
MTIASSPLLLCNYVYEDPVSHNVTLLGIFTSLRATKFPTPSGATMVYTLLSGNAGTVGLLSLQVVSEQNDSVCIDESQRVQIGDSGKRHVRFWLDIRFPEPGNYRFTLTFDTAVIGETTLLVRST